MLYLNILMEDKSFRFITLSQLYCKDKKVYIHTLDGTIYVSDNVDYNKVFELIFLKGDQYCRFTCDGLFCYINICNYGSFKIN